MKQVKKVSIVENKKEYPDIDVDIDGDYREDLVNYLSDMYGSMNVSLVGNLVFYQPKRIIQDLARVYNIPASQYTRCTKVYNNDLDVYQNIKLSKEVADFFENYPFLKDKIDVLVGTASNYGVHAGGIVITNRNYPINRYCPLQKTKDESLPATMWTKEYLQQIGFIKYDLLGVKATSVIHKARKALGLNFYSDFEEDTEVFKNIVLPGYNKNIFQFESNVGKKAFFDLMPMSINDLTAATAIIRLLGSESGRDYYDKYKSNVIDYQQGNTEYWKTVLKEEIYEQNTYNILVNILSETYGVLIYQEQIAWLVQKISNGKKTFNDGDKGLRKKIDKFGTKFGKIDPRQGNKQALKEWHDEFIKIIQEYLLPFLGKDGWDCPDKNVRDFLSFNLTVNNELPVPEKGIINWLITLTGYSFNKIHANAYSIITYNTMYLKYYYPKEFWWASLNTFSKDQDKIQNFISTIKEERRINNNLKILPPDVNKSENNFEIEENSIRFGLGSIKSLGKSAENIINVRKEKGNYTSLKDFLKKVDSRKVNKTVIQNLMYVNAFKNFGNLNEVYKEFINLGKSFNPLITNLKGLAEIEMTLLGTNITYIDPIFEQVKFFPGVNDLQDGDEKLLIVLIMKKYNKTTKKGKPYLLYRAKCLSGEEEVTFNLFDWNFADFYESTINKVRVKHYNGFYSLV